jgi:hypothetical protein
MARVGVGGYATLLAAVAWHRGGGWRTMPVLATIHLTWGCGVVFALLRTLPRRPIRYLRRQPRLPGDLASQHPDDDHEAIRRDSEAFGVDRSSAHPAA